MNMLANRFAVNKIISRFTQNESIEKICFSSIDLDNAMKSFNFPELEFTNFAKSVNYQVYKQLAELYRDYKSGKNILDKFEATELLPNDSVNRLEEIIKRQFEWDFLDTKKIIKCKNVDDDRLQLFIRDDKNKYKVVLIDIHHLGIPSKYRSVSKEEMQRRTYTICKKYKQGIEQIKSIIK